MNGPLFRRAAADQLALYVRTFPVVIVSGPRRTGKSTLVRTSPTTSDWSYRSLDEGTHLESAQRDPQRFALDAIPAVIDEVQRVPELLIAIKAVVDREITPRPGQFVLTGSADILNHPRVTESLAGRAGYMRLGPLTRREQLGTPQAGRWSELFDHPPTTWRSLLTDADAAPADWHEVARIGGLPEIVRAGDDAERQRRLLAYVDTYVERDLRDLAQVDSLTDFRRVMRGAALRVANLFNAAELSRDVQVPSTTVKRWIDLLEISYLLVRTEAFTVNRTSRLMKTPKIFWADTALALFLASLPEPTGAHLENMVLADLLVWRELYAPRPEVMHWRTNVREVDFVVERQNKVLGIEVKATTRPVAADWKHLLAFLDEYGDAALGGLLLHCGDDTFTISDRAVAAPWWRVF